MHGSWTDLALHSAVALGVGRWALGGRAPGRRARGRGAGGGGIGTRRRAPNRTTETTGRLDSTRLDSTPRLDSTRQLSPSDFIRKIRINDVHYFHFPVINLHVASFLNDPHQFACDFIPQQWRFISSLLMSHVRSASLLLLRRAWSELLMPRAHAPLPMPIHCRSSALRSMERRRLSSRRIHL